MARRKKQAEPLVEKPIHVFALGETHFWAAPGRVMWEYGDSTTFLLNCADAAYGPPFCVKGTVISLDWPDMGVPDMTRADWEAILVLLLSKPGNVGIYCMGGSGRTGTALSILLSLSRPVAGHCPVARMRRLYKPEAVESKAQIDYIEAITGEKVTAKPEVPKYFLDWENNFNPKKGSSNA